MIYISGIVFFTCRQKPSSTFTGNETAANPNAGNASSITMTAQWQAACTDTVFNYDYTGSIQTFKSGCDGYYQFEAWGAKGGDYNNNSSSSYRGGYGAYTKGSIQLAKNTTFYIYVGQKGQLASSYYGGWNGGGGVHQQAKQYINSSNNNYFGTGGGATDIRTTNNAVTEDNTNSSKLTNESGLRTRIMVAAAGGGGGLIGNCSATTGVAGGVAGTLTAPNAKGQYDGAGTHDYTFGGTQTSGGLGGGHESSGTINRNESAGAFGRGGAMGHCAWGGGGAGWYGGGGGSNNHGPGAGGSSYISGHLGSVAVTSLSSTSPKCSSGTTVACSESPTGYTFVNGTTQMIAGDASMPNPRGSGNITGNNGNGYARITYLGTSI